MTQSNSFNGTPEPGDDDAEVVRRIDANPPYEPRPADAGNCRAKEAMAGVNN
jgi:hypothetical protein